MTSIPTIVCPIDFSEGSRAALRYAAAIADHFGASLVALTVDDPLLAAAASHAGATTPLKHESELELRRFCGDALGEAAGAPKTLHFRVAIGKPAAEILRLPRIPPHRRGHLPTTFPDDTSMSLRFAAGSQTLRSPTRGHQLAQPEAFPRRRACST
jgi:hypothetical protein